MSVTRLYFSSKKEKYNNKKTKSTEKIIFFYFGFWNQMAKPCLIK
uniref:Uncharacterized protein n=1 Tax=Anguilla anguilla TaxID=7936 RepID=A0A0E9WFI0_ANGAN